MADQRLGVDAAQFFLTDLYGEHDFSQRDADIARVIPMMQKLLDNPFLLLFIGVMVPMVVYVLWGVIDILTIPVAK